MVRYRLSDRKSWWTCKALNIYLLVLVLFSAFMFTSVCIFNNMQKVFGREIAQWHQCKLKKNKKRWLCKHWMSQTCGVPPSPACAVQLILFIPIWLKIKRVLSEAIRRLKQYLPGVFQGQSTVHPENASRLACCSDDHVTLGVSTRLTVKTFGLRHSCRHNSGQLWKHKLIIFRMMAAISLWRLRAVPQGYSVRCSIFGQFCRSAAT